MDGEASRFCSHRSRPTILRRLLAIAQATSAYSNVSRVGITPGLFGRRRRLAYACAPEPGNRAHLDVAGAGGRDQRIRSGRLRDRADRTRSVRHSSSRVTGDSDGARRIPRVGADERRYLAHCQRRSHRVRIKNLPSINYAWGTVASFPSPDIAWVCQQGRARGSKPGSIGDTRTSSSPPGECFATSDGGRTWTTHNVPDSGTTSVGRGRDDATINGLTAADGRNAWIIVSTIATFAGGGQESINLIEVRLLHTLDAGAHWTSIRDIEAPPKASVAATGAEWVSIDSTGQLYVSGFDNGIDRSSDLGRSWQRLAVPIPAIGEPGTAQYCSIDAQGSLLLVTIREDVANVATALYEQSSNAGVSWSQVRAPAVASKPGQATPLC